MPNEKTTFRFGGEIIEKYEAEILAAMPELYPDEVDRFKVGMILIPQFREALAAVFEEFALERGHGEGQVLVPKEIPELCVVVDKMIKENRDLLGIEGMFGPVMERVQEVRGAVGEELEELFYSHCREILAEHGLTDRMSLFKIGPVRYLALDFGRYGYGKRFATRILGRFVNVDLKILKEISDILEFPYLSDFSKGEFRKMLASLIGIVC